MDLKDRIAGLLTEKPKQTATEITKALNAQQGAQPVMTAIVNQALYSSHGVFAMERETGKSAPLWSLSRTPHTFTVAFGGGNAVTVRDTTPDDTLEPLLRAAIAAFGPTYTVDGGAKDRVEKLLKD